MTNAPHTASTFTTRDGVAIYYKDWGRGQPVVFCHGWPLGADSWEAQMLHLSQNGFRTVAHDRRGHMRSSQPWDGNDMDTYTDDLNELFEKLDLKNAIVSNSKPTSHDKTTRSSKSLCEPTLVLYRLQTFRRFQLM